MDKIEKKITTETKKGAGRPSLQLDKVQIISLAKIHCTMKEIAAVMECSVDTLERNYADIIKRGKEKGKTSLRRYMWKGAEEGNVTMQIWLSKQLLGMHEPQIVETEEKAKGIFNEYYEEIIIE